MNIPIIPNENDLEKMTNKALVNLLEEVGTFINHQVLLDDTPILPNEITLYKVMRERGMDISQGK